ncbi:hypothetical protein [Lysinibacillus xylanilyticus]|uniref:hypothetical protein n=1 Tax=Lysinibacillus xylanilyticus TaxID=582475 RepID=UPI000A8F6E4A|nr:hypothetical protein [Lysinibacillus xylanilyticus]
MKAIEDLEKRLRGEMASRMDDRDIVDILEVLQGARQEIERLNQVITNYQT